MVVYSAIFLLPAVTALSDIAGDLFVSIYCRFFYLIFFIELIERPASN